MKFIIDKPFSFLLFRKKDLLQALNALYVKLDLSVSPDAYEIFVNKKQISLENINVYDISWEIFLKYFTENITSKNLLYEDLNKIIVHHVDLANWEYFNHILLYEAESEEDFFNENCNKEYVKWEKIASGEISETDDELTH